MTPSVNRRRSAPGRKRVIISIYDDPANPYYAGGGPAVVQRIVESLTDEYDVVVITGGHPGARRVVRHGASYLPLPLGWAGPRTGQVLYTLLLLLLAALMRYDLWIESFTPPFSSSFLPCVTGRPVLGVAQALSGREMTRRYRSRVFLHGERWALRRYQDVVVLNAHDGEQVLACSPGTRVHHIPNVIRESPTEVTDARQGSYALYMGRIEFEHKGLGLLLDAYRQLGDDALPLVIAGSGRRAEVRELEAALQTAGPRVSFIGFVAGERKVATLAGSAFVIVPSVEESFCLVALEALAHARPVVHFDLPQLSWIPADCGVTVPRFDTARLAAATRRLSEDLDERSSAGRRGRFFAEEFLARQAGNPYAQLVADVLAERASSPAALQAGCA